MDKASIKIACIGNMNNNMFCLVRYLRDMGYTAHLFLIEATNIQHFKPFNDSYSDDFSSYVLETNWLDLDIEERKKIVKEKLQIYDLTIGCGYAPAFLNEINRRLDIFYPYGSDLYEVPKPYFDATLFIKPFYVKFRSIKHIFYKIPNKINKPFQKKFWKYLIKANSYYYADQQYQGIKNCKLIALPVTNERFENTLTKINVKAKRLPLAFPFIYAPMYEKVNIMLAYENSIYYQQFKDIRDKFKLVIFHHARHQWKTSPDEFSWKGNDKLIKGFADFLKHSNNYKACLIMLEYGDDVAESKNLVNSLGIEKNVFWFPIMPRKEIMIGLSLSDIGCSEFSVSWAIGGTIYEILCIGKPLFHYLDYDLYSNESVFPHVNIQKQSDITDHLLKYIADPLVYIEIGNEGKAWFKKNAIESPLIELEKEILELRA